MPDTTMPDYLGLLNRISLAVLKHHVEVCVPDGIAKGEPEQSRRLAELVDIFDRFAK